MSGSSPDQLYLLQDARQACEPHTPSLRTAGLDAATKSRAVDALPGLLNSVVERGGARLAPGRDGADGHIVAARGQIEGPVATQIYDT